MKGDRFFKKKSNTGCLLVHGLTSSTQEMEEIADYLYSKNYTVLATLLKGHNTSIKDLNKTTWKDWYSSLLDDFNLLSKHCNKIYVIGSSVGATLSLHLATKQNSKLKGMILLAPAIFYINNLATLTPLLKYFKKYSTKDYKEYYPSRKEVFFDIANEKALKKRIAYKKVPISSIASTIKLINIVRKEIKNIDIPTLIIHSLNDHTIKPESSRYIYDNLAIKEKKLIFVEQSGHVLTVDFDKKRIFREILDFITKYKK